MAKRFIHKARSTVWWLRSLITRENCEILSYIPSWRSFIARTVYAGVTSRRWVRYWTISLSPMRLKASFSLREPQQTWESEANQPWVEASCATKKDRNSCTYHTNLISQIGFLLLSRKSGMLVYGKWVSSGTETYHISVASLAHLKRWLPWAQFWLRSHNDCADLSQHGASSASGTDGPAITWSNLLRWVREHWREGAGCADKSHRGWVPWWVEQMRRRRGTYG